MRKDGPVNENVMKPINDFKTGRVIQIPVQQSMSDVTIECNSEIRVYIA
jgi:hypothetical protein